MGIRADGGVRAATPSLRAFTSGAFYLAGGIASLLTTVRWWHEPTARSLGTVVLAVSAIVVGVALLLWGARLARWCFHAIAAQATLLLGVGVLISADQVAAIAIAAQFAFSAVTTVYFFTGRIAMAQSMMLLVVAVTSMLARGIDSGVVAALVIVEAAIVVVIGRLVTRASQSTTDSLTGLLNRRGFDEQLQEALLSAGRTGAPLSLAFIDLDHFKTVNDTLGHAAGDEVLVRLAEVLGRELPAGSLLARQGGDEFAVAVRGRTSWQAAQVLEQVRLTMAPQGLSVGIAEVEDAGHDAPALLRRADAALYAAKGAGRGCVRVAGDPDEQGLLGDLTPIADPGR